MVRDLAVPLPVTIIAEMLRWDSSVQMLLPRAPRGAPEARVRGLGACTRATHERECIDSFVVRGLKTLPLRAA